MHNHLELVIDALRSGEYPRTTSTLCEQYGGELHYCCMGVMESLRLGVEDPDGDLPKPELAAWLGMEYPKRLHTTGQGVDFREEWDVKMDFTGATLEEMQEYGVPETEARNIEGRGGSKLISLSYINDDWGLGFETIADLLERFPLTNKDV